MLSSVFPLCRVKWKFPNNHFTEKVNFVFEYLKILINKLELRLWFNMLIVLSVAVFFLVATGAVTIFPAIPTALISLGVFFMALGEKQNHVARHYSRPEWIYSGGILWKHQIIYQRRNTVLGWLFILLGLTLNIVGVVKLIF